VIPSLHGFASDIEMLRAALAAERDRAARIEPSWRWPAPRNADDAATIARQNLEIAKLKRQIYGPRSERTARLLDQMELELEELERPPPRTRSPPSRPPPRPRTCAVHAQAPVAPAVPGAPAARARRRSGADDLRPCCGGTRLRKLGEDVTETLEVIPRQWKVIQHVREKFSCRDCEKDQRAAGAVPRHAARLGRPEPAGHAAVREVRPAPAAEPAGERYAARACRSACRRSPIRSAPARGAAPLHASIEAHVFAAERLHGDDTTVPVLAKGKTDTGRCWVYVRDDRPFGGRSAGGPVLLLARSRRRSSVERISRAMVRHAAGRRLCRLQPALRGRSQAGTDPGGGLLGACAAAVLRARRHRGQRPPQGRRQGRRRSRRWRWRPCSASIALFEIERGINGKSADERRAVRQELSAPLVADLEAWMRAERAEALARQRSRQGHGLHAQALAGLHALPRRRPRLPDEQCRRAQRCAVLPSAKVVALRRLRSRRQRAAVMYSLIVTAKLNDVDPQAWLADVLARIAGHPASRSTSCCRGTGDCVTSAQAVSKAVKMGLLTI
jgi:transposase